MFEWMQQALEKAGIGIVITDASQKIVFWNDEMEKLSEVSKREALNKRLSEICPKFAERRYQEILDQVITSGQSRFCSSVLHRAFVYPRNKAGEENMRQNLKAEPILLNEEVAYVFLQISDVTEQVRNERRLKAQMNELQKGYIKIKESEEAAMRMARYDALTGILNRRAFETELETAIKETKTAGKKFALLFLDLDGFKHVNDTYGHIVGDVLLQQVAGRLRSNTRHNGRRQEDIIARIGGDEFVVALMGMRSEKDAFIVADKIVSFIRKTFFIDNKRINISASVGIAVYPDDADSVKALIDAADRAMYRIKQSGKDDISFYNLVNLNYT